MLLQLFNNTNHFNWHVTDVHSFLQIPHIDGGMAVTSWFLKIRMFVKKMSIARSDQKFSGV